VVETVASAPPGRRQGPASAASAFDAAAEGYDAEFTATRLGQWLRQAVWAELTAAFQPGDHVLELGCGTGEDAVWLAGRGIRVLATDGSPAMLNLAHAKARRAGVEARVTFACLDLGAGLFGSSVPAARTFDGAFSNFGALNCLPDRRLLAQALARHLRPGARIVLVLMGPLCPWEIAWHLAHGDASRGLRRWRGGVDVDLGDGAPIRVWYPSPRRVRAEFAPYFDPLCSAGIGTLLPPTYLSHLVERWPDWLSELAVWESRVRHRFPWTWLNDHYLLVLERR
jgi:SAM-dependent methyltransferase